jgi:hypothetical protein
MTVQEVRYAVNDIWNKSLMRNALKSLSRRGCMGFGHYWLSGWNVCEYFSGPHRQCLPCHPPPPPPAPYILLHSCFLGEPGSSVGIATAYGLDGPGIESRWEAKFSATVQTGPEAHPPYCAVGTVSFPRVRCGRGVTLTPHPLLVLRSKIEQSYTSTLPKGLCGLWKGETYLVSWLTLLPIFSFYIRELNMSAKIMLICSTHNS